MKIVLAITRFIVGVLFIFSGLIKANDPVGLSYKMQEFFEVWGWNGLHDFTLTIAILMITFEIVAGVAVLLGWQFKLFSWLLLLLMIFFTFLTGYAVLSGKIRECGCFGDCIKLTAKDSFIKDLVLLGLILVLVAFRNRVKPLFSNLTNLIILAATVVLSITLQWWVLRHMPVIDCLPFKAGNNIHQKMQNPPGSIPDSTVITFVYKKDGKDVEFTADKFPADFGDNYLFVKRYDKLIRKGNAEPPIKDFALSTFEGTEITQEFLNEPGYKLVLFLKDGYDKQKWPEVFDLVVTTGNQKKIPSFVVTNIPQETLRADSVVSASVFPLRCDVTAIKTAARANPTLYLLNAGTIVDKWGYADFELALTKLRELK